MRAACAFDPGAALDQLLLDLGALGGEEELVLSLCPHHRLANNDVRPGHRLVRREALCDLLVQRDLERVALDGCAVRRTRGRDRRELSRMPTGGSAREGAGPKRRLASAFAGEPAVAREAPRAVHEDADADPLALRVREPLDSSVLRRDELVALGDHACVGVLGPSPGRRIDRGCSTHHASRRTFISRTWRT